MLRSRSRSPSPDLSPLAVGPDLAPLPALKEPATTTVSFSGLLSAPLALHEDVAAGCGGQCWPAGMVLARHMLRYHRDDLDGANILELGAGGGLVGLAVARGCALEPPVIVTDQAAMLPLMAQNVRLNGLQDRVVPLELSWGDPLPARVRAHKPTVILAADCVYFEPAFPLLLATLRQLLDLSPAAAVYFCFKKRRRADMQFMKKARKIFLVDEVADEERAVWGKEGLFLYLFRRKASVADTEENR